MLPRINRHDETIRTLQLIKNAGFESAIIAGGAIRDLYFDIMPTDIDIFVWDPHFSPEGTDHAAWYANSGGTFWEDVLKLNRRSTVYTSDCVRQSFVDYGPQQIGSGKITAVWNVLKGYMPYQIIFTVEKPTTHIMKFFDVGLCKAYCDGDVVRYTSEFMHDAKNEQFTVLGQDMSQREFNYAMDHHIPKLQAKFPKYKTVIADHNQKLYLDYKQKTF